MFREDDFGSVPQFGANPHGELPAPAEPVRSLEAQPEVRSESDLCPPDEGVCAGAQAAFFGLRRMPFGVTSNPRPLLFAAREALKELAYGIRTQRGLLLLTGEAGTGKATLLRHLLEWLYEEGIPVAFVCGPGLDGGRLYEAMFREFGIGSRLKTNSPRLLRTWLSGRSARGGTAVLILNEAQNLSLDVLEEICMLLNLETPREKMLQVVLAGQPELEQMIRRPELVSLRQRIALRCKLSPFGAEETNQYVEECLRMAGKQSDAPLFSPEAMEAIQVYSRGVPRDVDSLCERALAMAWAEQIRPVSACMIERAARELPVGRVEAPSPSAEAGAVEIGDLAPARSLAALSALLERATRVLESRASALESEPDESMATPVPVPAAASTDTGRIETNLDLGSLIAADSELVEDGGKAVETPGSQWSAPPLGLAPPIAEESSQPLSTGFNREIAQPEAALIEAVPDTLPQSPYALLAGRGRRTPGWLGEPLSRIARNPRVRIIASPSRWLRGPIRPARLLRGWWSTARDLALLKSIDSERIRSSWFQVSRWLRQPFDPARLLRKPIHAMQLLTRYFYVAPRTPSHKKS
jgi:general secretion pathway protein A